MLPQETLDAARDLLAAMEARGLTLATAESCTGGLIAAALTAIPAPAAVGRRAYVTSWRGGRQRDLGGRAGGRGGVGAVGEGAASARGGGGLRRGGVDLALSCTGIAGPGGATPAKPVGLVFIGAARRGGETVVQRHVFPGDRAAVRAATVAEALALAARSLGDPGAACFG